MGRPDSVPAYVGRGERFIDLGDRVLVLLTQIGRGRGSGVVAERPVSFLFTFRNGKIVRLEGHWDQAEGLRAAGLDSSAS